MNYLYRALRTKEIECGNVLIPKSTDTFKSELRFPLVFPVTFGENEKHAVRDHQWDGKYPTRLLDVNYLVRSATTMMAG